MRQSPRQMHFFEYCQKPLPLHNVSSDASGLFMNHLVFTDQCGNAESCFHGDEAVFLATTLPLLPSFCTIRSIDSISVKSRDAYSKLSLAPQVQLLYVYK